MSASLFVATPAADQKVFANYVAGLCELTREAPKRGIGLDWYIQGNLGLVQARNMLASMFLRTNYTHLLFVDNDIGFDAADVFRMMDANLDVVGGIYPMKVVLWDRVAEAARRGVSDPVALLRSGSSYCGNFEDPNAVKVDITPHGHFAEALEVGTGFMLIKRHVLEDMIAHYGAQIEYRNNFIRDTARLDHWAEAGDREYAFFDTWVDRDRMQYLTEDWVFCRRWRGMGGKVYAALDVKLAHSGTHTWFGNPWTRAQVAEPAAARLNVPTTTTEALPAEAAEVDAPPDAATPERVRELGARMHSARKEAAE
jgi:hypothetical protein